MGAAVSSRHDYHGYQPYGIRVSFKTRYGGMENFGISRESVLMMIEKMTLERLEPKTITIECADRYKETGIIEFFVNQPELLAQLAQQEPELTVNLKFGDFTGIETLIEKLKIVSTASGISLSFKFIQME